MPNTALTQAIEEAYASAPSAEIIHHTLEFRHPNFVDEYGGAAAIRVVRDHVGITATLESDAPLAPGASVYFMPFSFDFQLPGVEENATPEIIITIDNVSQLIETNLANAVASPYKVEVTYRPYLGSDLTQPQMDPPLTLVITSVEATDYQVVARATYGDLANKRFPNVDYTVDEFPGLGR